MPLFRYFLPPFRKSPYPKSCSRQIRCMMSVIPDCASNPKKKRVSCQQQERELRPPRTNPANNRIAHPASPHYIPDHNNDSSSAEQCLHLLNLEQSILFVHR